jgi:hypothetical protein
MKRKVVFSAMLAALLALGFVFVACEDEPPGGGKIDWHGTYEDDDESITFAGTSISGECNISNVSIGETRTIKDDEDTVTWAYVFKDENTKIGIIYQHTMTIGSYSETSYTIRLGKENWENSGSSTHKLIDDDGCDVSDMTDEYDFSGERED